MEFEELARRLDEAYRNTAARFPQPGVRIEKVKNRAGQEQDTLIVTGLDLAADYISALETMKIGEWWAAQRTHGHRPEIVGKPLTAATKDGYLITLRRFFSDLQEIPHRVSGEAKARTIIRHFNPMVALQTPRSIKNVMGPDPRVIDDAWWWKLVAAAETLTEADIPHCGNGGLLYPLEFVRAVAATWCYSARRSDEIKRLRVGCIRWQWENTMLSEDGGSIPEDAICFLQIPVNKTNTAFTTAVYSLVGKYIEAWEKVRPPQPKMLDRKTNEMVDFLFSLRGHRMAGKYINDTIIPLLCERAGVPRVDRRGNITSHRARATIASQYLQCSRRIDLFRTATVSWTSKFQINASLRETISDKIGEIGPTSQQALTPRQSTR